MTTTSIQPIQPRTRRVDGVSIRFAESEERDDHALLLSPWPESLYAFGPIWSRLAEHAHLVAVDLPGFGHSERHDALLTPRAMGDFIIRVADAFGLDNPHVVGPDIGTSASLFAASAHPGRLRSVVVGSGGAAVPIQLGEVLRDWVLAPDVEVFRTEGRDVIEAVLPHIEGYAIPDHVREDYLSSYEGDRFFRSLPYVRSYPKQLPVLRDLLPEVQTPVQIIAGRHDTAVPLVNAEFLHERLPNSKLDIVEAGHFTWESAPDDYAAIVTAWWDSHKLTGSVTTPH